MKDIYQNWRNYREDALLVEEIENLFNQLEQQLLNEGLMDSLSDTWDSIKTSTGKAKDKAIEIYNKIMEKINDWILKVSVKVHNMAKSAVGGALNLLVNVVRKVSGFCGKHSTLCKMILFIVTLLAIYTIMSYLFAGEAQADVIIRGKKLTQEELDVFEGIVKMEELPTEWEWGATRGAKIAANLREFHNYTETYDISADISQLGWREIRDRYGMGKELLQQVDSLVRAGRLVGASVGSRGRNPCRD